MALLLVLPTLVSGLRAAPQGPQAPPGVYWLDTGPERGPYNDQTLRHGHRSPIDVVAGSVFLSLPNYLVPQGLAVDAGEGKVYTNHRSLFTGQITIRKMNLDGSGLETLHVFPGGSYGQMEFNPADGKLYIVNGANFARMNASSAAIAAGGGVNVEMIAFPSTFSVTRVDIDLVSGSLIVMNTNATGNWPFYSINFDGTGAQALGASCPPHTCYQGFAVDGRSQKIYYSRRGPGSDSRGYVYTQNYDGSANQVLYGPNGANEYLNAVSLAINFETDDLIMAVGREGFGGHLSRGKLDGSLFLQTYYNAALDFAPNFVALGSVPGGGGGPVACTAGTYSSTGNAPCEPAQPGYSVSTTGATSQTACPVGTYSSVTGAESCQMAPAGSYVNTVGANGSLMCPAGTYSATAGSASCTPASAGFFVALIGATSQTACAAGYGSAAGATECYLLDSDGDGVADATDAFPNSNLTPLVSVGTCNTGVANGRLANGATFNDLLGAAQAASGGTHGKWVSAVTALSNGWKSAGLITGQEHGKIVSCVAQQKR